MILETLGEMLTAGECKFQGDVGYGFRRFEQFFHGFVEAKPHAIFGWSYSRLLVKELIKVHRA